MEGRTHWAEARTLEHTKRVEARTWSRSLLEDLGAQNE
jgi:hypothetical protein